MATEPVSLPHNNSLQALRQLVEERMREVRDSFLELRTALQQCEESVAGSLDKLYSDTRESVESSERTIQQLEEAKNAMQATLVDNKMNVFLQATIQSIDSQIAEVRNSTALVPKRIQLEWRRDAKQCIQTLCKVISSTDDTSCGTGAPEPIPLPAQNIETEIELLKQQHAAETAELLEREDKHKQTISQLKGRIANKEKLVSYKVEELKSLEEEMGRFSEKSHQVEKELKQLKLQLSKRGAAAPGSFNTGNQSGMTYSEATTSSSKEFHEDIQELNMNLSLKTSECYDLKKEVSSLKTELKGAQELLASKLDVASQFEATESERDVCEVSVSLSLGHELKRPTGQAMRRQHSDTTAQWSKLAYDISGKRKQSGPPSAAAVHIQHKYKLTDIWLNGKYSKFYSLNQVEKPEDLVGELALCKPRGTVRYVIGTIKVIIPGRYEHDKTIAGIEFLDPLGDSNGEYRNTLYFNAERKHAIFLPVNEVYISHDPKMTD